MFGPNVPAHHLPLSAELIHSNQFITEPFISLNDMHDPRERPKHGSMPWPRPQPSSYGTGPTDEPPWPGFLFAWALC